MQSGRGMKTTNLGIVALASVIAVGGCVSKGKYDEQVAQTETTRAQLAKANAQLNQTTQTLAQANEQLEAAKTEIGRLELLIADATKSSESDRQTNTARVSELRKRLDELKAARDAMEARAALFRQLASKLKRQVDAGDLEIVIRDGRMVLRLPNDVLFDTGRTELKPAGKDALAAIAGVLSSMPDRHFQVAGHTDNVPIHNREFASNWELSSGRALRVVHFLIDKGAISSTLSAAGYGEMDPVATNESPEGRQYNRRTEITVQPNISELVPVP